MQNTGLFEHLSKFGQQALTVGLLVAAALVLSIAENLIYNRVLPHIKKSRHNWDDALLEAFHQPFHIFIWVFLGIYLVATYLFGFSNPFIVRVFQVALILFLLWVSLRFAERLERNLATRSQSKVPQLDMPTIRAIAQMFRMLAVIIAAIIILQTWGVQLSGFLAVGGVGALAISFAAKDNLANILGSFMIHLDRAFSVGEWIRSPDRNIEGTVEHIGWRQTRIRTFDKRPLFVPNSIFSTISIENPSRMSNRRIKTNIGLRYEDGPKVDAILKAIRSMLQNHEEIDTKQTLMVNLFEFGESSLNFFVYTFTKTTDWVKFQAIQEDVFLKILAIIDEHGAECAFPTRTLDVPDMIPITTTASTENDKH